MSRPRRTVRTDKAPPVGRAFGPGDVQRVRGRLGVSQAVRTRFLGVTVNAVRSGEQGRRPPQPIACRFLAEIEADPESWRRRVVAGGGAVEAKEPTG